VVTNGKNRLSLLQRSYTPCDGFLLSLKFAPILPQNVDRNDKFKDWNGDRTQLSQRKFEQIDSVLRSSVRRNSRFRSLPRHAIRNRAGSLFRGPPRRGIVLG
jgi:hypothetical protein